MDTLQVVLGGAVINVIVVEAGSTISSDKKSAHWTGGSYSLATDGELWNVEGAQIGWVVSGGTLSPPIGENTPA